MAVAAKPKAKHVHHKKRSAAHHKKTKHYVKSYWPYLPMLLVVVAGFVLNTLFVAPSAVLGESTDLTPKTLASSTNQARIDNDQQPLSLNAQLTLAAQAKANHMAKQNYWSHSTPDGTDPWHFITAANYEYQAAGENLAYGFNSASGAIRGWLSSAEHRNNLLSSNYSEVGFGVVQASDFIGKGRQTILVAMYAKPATGQAAVLNQQTNSPSSQTPVSTLSVMALPMGLGFALGIAAAISITSLIYRHSKAWHRALLKGERLVLNHPILDTLFVVVIVGAVMLLQTNGLVA